MNPTFALLACTVGGFCLGQISGYAKGMRRDWRRKS